MSLSISVVIVDTDCHALAFNALHQSVTQFDVQQVIIFSDRPEAWPGYPVICIDPITSIEAYNQLITKRLAEELICDHALIIQFDGFILNPQEWAPLFLHYDYIGAPWPNYSEHAVGNGGFSLRSRRLIEAVAELEYSDLSEPEDLFICRRMRPALEEKGLRFASREIAAHFSVEWPSVPWPTFGFHGIFHLPDVYRNNIEFLIDNLSDRVVRARWKYFFPAVHKISSVVAIKLQKRVADFGGFKSEVQHPDFQ